MIPPLRIQGVSDAGDRWAQDVAGTLPVTDKGNRYLEAAVDYATQYSLVAAVLDHRAPDVPNFIIEKLVMVYGLMREHVMDEAAELSDAVVEALVNTLFAKRLTPVPYRPALLEVEHFHRTWKAMVARFVSEAQCDWIGGCRAQSMRTTGRATRGRVIALTDWRSMNCCVSRCVRRIPSGIS